MSLINNIDYLTPNHFSLIDFDNKLTETETESNDSEFNSDSDSDSESESESDSDSDSESGSDSDTKTDSNSNNGSKSISDSESDSESETESELNMEIDPDDLFNTKTNGHEFFGEVLKNRYLILKKLGYGSFSSVWMAYDIQSNSLVAIKIINPRDYKEGMLEIKTYKKLDELDNTYLLTMIDCFEVVPIHQKYYTETYKEDYPKMRNHIVMVLPLMACSTFDLLKCSEYEDGLPLDICIQIVLQTLLGIKEFEKHNLMHTDLKPENILVCGLNREAELLLKTIQDIDIKNVHREQLEKLSSTNMDDNFIWTTSYKLFKEITKTIIKFMKNDMSEVKKQMKLCKVSSKYIKDIKIKICDFNLVMDASENIENIVEIQTRYYRAPEILVKNGLHNKTDYWSIGCIFFELLTGEILFNPDKDKEYSRDVHHMYLIEELLGSVPKHMIRDSKLYDQKGYLINVGKKVKKWDLTSVLKENHDNLGLTEDKILSVVKFISSCLEINPDNRPNIKNMIDALKKI